MNTENTVHSKTFIDLICGMTVNPESAAGKYEYEGTTYYFCSKGCLNKFTAEKKSQTATVQISRPPEIVKHGEMTAAPKGEFVDPVCGMTVRPDTAAGSHGHNGTTFYFCSVGCLDKFIHGFFKIVAESGVAAGVRRIEALTGQGAYEWVLHTDQMLRDIAGLVRGSREEAEEKIRELLERTRKQEKEIQQLKSRLATGQGGDLSAQAVVVDGIKVLATQIEGADAKSLRDAVDQLKQKLGSSVVVLATVEGGKVVLVAGVSADLMGRLKAGDIVGAVASQVGGRGGGRADFAQAGGTQPENLAAALAGVEALVKNRLAA